MSRIPAYLAAGAVLAVIALCPGKTTHDPAPSPGVCATEPANLRHCAQPPSKEAK